MKWLLALLLCFSLLACSAPDANIVEPAPVEETPVVPAETPIAEVPIPSPIAEKPADAAENVDEDFARADEGLTFDGPVERIICDPTTKTLTFTITNPTPYIWNIDRDLSWPSPKGYAVASISLNGVELNAKEQRFFEGKAIGKSPFSRNCDVEELAPGATMTCSLAPVPLRTVTGEDADTNEFALSATGVYKVVTFLC
jgi:hypothetical protein